jgi:hypothetical protein
MKTLIIGKGEIGNALFEVLSPVYETQAIDKLGKHGKAVGDFEIIHICFPYSKKFNKEVRKYQKLYKPKFTVIHSTVPVGTSNKLNACHSPVIGRHPFLIKSLKTFIKFVGGKDVDEVADYFRKAGIRVQLCRKSETTELAKLASTLYYSLCIEYAKEVEKLCQKYKVPYSEAYILWNMAYNEGYSKMGESVIRPILQPIQRKIGGHCLIPNLDLLDSKFSKFIKGLNK